MSRFKDRLWSDLVRVHGSDLSKLSRPEPKSRPRPRVLAGTGLGLVAAGSAAAILIGTAGTTPAFAVTKNNDGSVTVWVARPAGIPQANARLAALGYRARLVQITAACGAPAALARSVHGPPPIPLPPRQVRGGEVRWAAVPAQARFDPRQIPAGRLLVIPASRSGQTIRVRPGRMIHGQAPACLPPPPIPVPGRLLGACCPPPSATARPGRQVLAPCVPKPALRPWLGHGRQRPWRWYSHPGGPPKKPLHGYGRPWTQAAVSCPAGVYGHSRHRRQQHHR